MGLCRELNTRMCIADNQEKWEISGIVNRKRLVRFWYSDTVGCSAAIYK